MGDNLKIFPIRKKLAYNIPMDMKKKLQETYLPDQDTRRPKMIIGLSGGLNSYVTAYLLKLQKYDLIGVTIAMKWDDFSGDPSKVLSCHLNQPELDHIKEFCHQLGIPHMLVKAAEEFREGVVDNWLGSRMTGTKPNPCWSCHELKMQLLFKKMKELDAHGMATGHLGKIFFQEKSGHAYVHTSNDELHDQSDFLSRLPHSILEKLMLPLSDLHQKEIDKLGENFGIHTQPKKIKVHECFSSGPETEGYLKTHIPQKYVTSGELQAYDKSSLGEHQGIFHYQYGQVVPTLGYKQEETLLLNKFALKDKKMELVKADFFIRKSVFLYNCKISDETPWQEPMKGVAKFDNGEFVDCFVYPKNIAGAVIEFDQAHSVFEGSILSILKRRGKSSKIFLTGKVRYISEEPVVIETEEGIQSVKVNYSRDF